MNLTTTVNADKRYYLDEGTIENCGSVLDTLSEDYSMYAFPALRALEGHIKFLITQAGGNPGRQFSCFGLDKTVTPNRYVVTEHFTDGSKNNSIENCFNYYKSQRDTDFHFGDIIGTTDNTRFIETKEEADEIIQKCLDLISSEQ